MRPHDGPWAVVHCVKCEKSCDLWYEQPETVEVETAPLPFKMQYDLADTTEFDFSRSTGRGKKGLMNALEILRATKKLLRKD